MFVPGFHCRLWIINNGKNLLAGILQVSPVPESFIYVHKNLLKFIFLIALIDTSDKGVHC